MLQQGKNVALDVIANVRATEEAIAELADRQRPVTVSDIERLQHVIEPSLPAGVRQEQNWVGGSGWSPLRAEFVPPPETEVHRLLENLAEFVTATAGNPVVRAALAHAQFETIHPFIDGNGRTGRALIHTVLKRSDALRNILVPISTVFAGNKDAYIDGLTDYRADRSDDWIIGFSRAAEPVLTVDRVAATYGVSTVAAQGALNQLGDAGILSRTKDHKGRLVCWTSDRHLGLVALTERSNRHARNTS